ncbi:hypothetical protein HYPBUDRAFT_135245 [Hyphopichia burtonii NRRL Y-1933]|uniref:STB6-like N-terminal domain-containing protein n=1 Tax=Hyphopichia burtonii NRRL Y-1933 TaxID=984485 RepID=A0A1E4RNG0_9ASCO|nr:hypothetical protein HYPBUDRAFT_135245 [Hyphopichia burtonii NRRL Y-1933]ODV68731.1 hypothetical protein HYPBUDRAFT_135245 [Hyphopichia burtonii NRRL Y-1933]
MMEASRKINQKPPHVSSNDHIPSLDSNPLNVNPVSNATSTHDPGRLSINPSNELITYIFPDFNAVKYFQREFMQLNEFHLIEESRASGFDIYMVEQWVYNRKVGSIVSTFTGNMSSEISVIKFTILKKPTKNYPLRFQEYLNEVMLNHGKLKKMDQSRSKVSSDIDNHVNEYLFVTNLTALPPNLNLIPIPQNDARVIEEFFILNSNLKKLHCSGRSTYLITDKISDANEDKFRHMYKIYNTTIPIEFAIRELINIIQTCLFYFDLLDAKYCDGLLCNKTEEAILNWWNLIGLPHFNVKPNNHHGILPSRTVAGIISLIISVKLRLHLIGGCDAPKDPFDFENFMISIGQFQKQFKLEKKRKLDLDTINKLFTITNHKLLPDYNNSHYNNSSPSNDYNKDDLDDSFDSMANMSAATYRRNKHYYRKEMKKITDVVKNTVQDHMSTKDDDNYFFTDSSTNLKSSGAKLRNRIAKLADSVSPIDVETLDLEILVKNYLVGKTLHRLWYATSSSGNNVNTSNNTSSNKKFGNDSQFTNGNDNTASSNQRHGYHHHHHHHHHHLHNNNNYSTSSRHKNGFADKAIPKNYQFVSLKDSITKSQGIGFANPNSSLISEPSRYSRGLNKMKFGLLNKRGLLSTNADQKSGSKPYQDDSSNEDISYANELNGATDPREINCSADENRGQHSNQINDCSNKNRDIFEEDDLHQFQMNLNRRNSFPFVKKKGEINLDIIEFLRNEKVTTKEKRHNKNSDHNSLQNNNLEIMNDYRLKKTRSFSNLEDLPLPTNQSINKKYQQLNLELIRLHNNHNQMVSNKVKIIDEDLSGNLDYKISDLTATIDRIVYETRIVVQRINELEENSNLFDSKLNDQCMKKLATIINHLVRLNKFKKVFDDPDERNELVLKLTGNSESELVNRVDKNSIDNEGLFRLIVIFIYDMIDFIFQLFKFDRSKMNLDRIRQSWGKLDPNRKYINKAYSYLGRDPTRGVDIEELKKDEPENESPLHISLANENETTMESSSNDEHKLSSSSSLSL